MQEAKIDNYLNQINSGLLESNKTIVLNAIMEMNGNTIHDLRIILKMKHQTLTGVLNQLLDSGIIKTNGKTMIDNKSYSLLIFVHDPVNRQAFIEKRLMKKFESWKKRGLKEFSCFLMDFTKIELNGL